MKIEELQQKDSLLLVSTKGLCQAFFLLPSSLGLCFSVIIVKSEN